LLKYVMYNLFKNAFHHRKSEDFHIHVSMISSERFNQIVVTDNGAGIAPDVLRNIFQDFYTTGKSGSYGLGLPFCKKVMRSFGGNIECQSQLGEWSQFTLTFPLTTSDTVTEIKNDLTKLKTILTVTSQDILVSKVTDISRFMGFDSTILDANQVLKKKEYEFEFGLLFIDLESLDPRANPL
ncbi:ATP-binding protein, partial [Vibrio parahaemolyticus]|uniref:ATP-binding protein n=1 Tax=Vibrio parahaemolyticus TaxID=670 RepID=UPI0017CBAAE0